MLISALIFERWRSKVAVFTSVGVQTVTNRTCPLIAALLTAVLLLPGCDLSRGGDEYFPPATEILRVEVEPNPVAAGDTAVFTCVIEDSLESGFIFVWDLEGLGNIDTATTNRYQWIAPSSARTYSHTVIVDDLYAEVEPVQQPFEITVVDSN